MAQPQGERTITVQEPPPYLSDVLEDAERLLKYAAENGIPIEEKTRDHVVRARVLGKDNCDQETVTNLLAALSDLAAQLKPVTAASLKWCVRRPAMRKYWGVSIFLVVLIVPFSVISFVTSAISTTIKTDIASANDLAVKLRAQLGPPADKSETAQRSPQMNPTSSAGIKTDPIVDGTVITELQQFASDVREVDRCARQLNRFVLGAEVDPIKAVNRQSAEELQKEFELPLTLNSSTFPQVASDLTYKYQQFRYFGQSAVADVTVVYGAVVACLLPVLYALLGTCAYLLRTFEQQISSRTYTPSAADSQRFLMAGIGGAVVGLFNNLVIGQSVSIPPLALAFLVGYAVDVFFSFLESVFQKLTAGRGTGSPAPSTDGGKA